MVAKNESSETPKTPDAPAGTSHARKLMPHKIFWELGLHRVFYGPGDFEKLARRRGEHLPITTYWPANWGMPYRKCTCGLEVDAPDLIVLHDWEAGKRAPGTYWPNDPVERERIQRTFFDAIGHKKLRVRKTSDEGDVE